MIRTYSLLIFGLLFIAACGNPKELVYQDVKNFKVHQLSLTPEVGMDVQFYNPNTFGMTLKDANIDVFINDQPIGKATLNTSFKVPGLDTFLLPVKLNANLSNVFANAIAILANRNVKVRLDGNVMAGRGVFVNIPIHYEGIQKLDVLEFK